MERNKMNENINITIKDNEIEIVGLEIKPYWKRILFTLCWWKKPIFILRSPKIIYNGKLIGEKK